MSKEQKLKPQTITWCVECGSGLNAQKFCPECEQNEIYAYEWGFNVGKRHKEPKLEEIKELEVMIKECIDKPKGVVPHSVSDYFGGNLK